MFIIQFYVLCLLSTNNYIHSNFKFILYEFGFFFEKVRVNQILDNELQLKYIGFFKNNKRNKMYILYMTKKLLK